ncbi:helix-turn-helix transcriptional regulator [Streptomyces hydrogenans]|uniref:helix-turn-helix transcriptional regulator n=1 Tax=Streptomyces hydrogenans TaxID=1873719 RepID=UPI0036A8242C
MRRSPITAARRFEEKLTVDELCEELRISRSTFYDWRQKGRAPQCVKLPNGSLRVRRSDLENWLIDCEAAA